MALGVSATIANTLVDSVTGAGGGGYLQYHTGDPGASGTTAQVGARAAVAFPSASGGTATQTGTATIASWAGGSVTLTHASYFSASSGGTFRGSFALTASRVVVNGDNVSMSGATVTVSTVAA